MNLIFRLFRVLVAALFRSRLGLLDESVVTFRVLPSDLDFNLHMNNGRYLSIMDLGRVDLMVRLGLLGVMRRQRWRPVLGAETIVFRRSLTPFQAYRLHTRIVCWDDRFIYLEQIFRTGGQADGRTAASAIAKAAVLGQQRTQRPRDMLRTLGLARRSPPMPPAIKAWGLAEEWLLEPRETRRGAARLDADPADPKPAADPS